MQNTNVTLQTSLLPFNREFKTIGLNNCKTLQDVVNSTAPYNIQDCQLITVRNGSVIPSTEWENTFLKEGDIIGLNFIPMGGGGGKNTVMMVGLIAAAIVMPYAAAGLANLAVGAAWGATGVTWGVTGWSVYGATMIAGSMIMTMAQRSLMSTPKQSSGSNTKESQTMFIEGANNSIDKYGVVPINLGTNRMFPNQAALPYTETIENKQYIRQLFTYGYGKLAIRERKLGETDIDNFSELEYEDKLNADLHTGTKLYSKDVYQENFSAALTKSGGFVLKTTQTDTNESEIDITFQGLCKYDDDGKKKETTVKFEIQYAPTGTSTWSVPEGGMTVSGSQSLSLNLSKTYTSVKNNKGPDKSIRIDTFIILDTYNGEVTTKSKTVSYNKSVSFPSLVEGEAVLGYIKGKTSSNGSLAYVDNRSSLVGKYIKTINDFVTTVNLSNPSSVSVNVSGGDIIGSAGSLIVRAATTQTLRKTKRFVFRTKGQYDIRIRRLTNDSTDDKILDKAYLTAIKSISYVNPVSFKNISGTAIRIRATDQLNGSIDSYNVVASTYLKGYDPNNNVWVDNVISSNPADIFRYVLQSPAFAKALPDSKIDLDKLAEWWIYCNSIGLTYDRVIDYDTSVDDVLNDICAAGVATLSKVNNIYSVIIDNERPIIKGMVTPRNSWDYKGNINYPDLPHALRIEFRNSEKSYETDERIVYRDGYNASNATLYERLQFPSCTNAQLAYWYGRRYFATALLQPETHTFKMDFEHMTFNRGDRITLVNDVILVGVGQGRIKELIVDDEDNPSSLLGFVIDDKINLPNVSNLGVRIRDNAVTQGYQYHLLQETSGTTDIFYFVEAVNYENSPSIGSLCAFVEDGKELDLIITDIKPDKEQSATITAVDYAPDRFNPLGVIPDFNSNITIPLDFYKPYSPILMSDIQTDESVMLRNSDGSLTSLAVISLINRNSDDVLPLIKIRRVDTTEWYIPSTLKKENDQIFVTGLEDGVSYDFQIFYQRRTGLQLISDPLLIENVKFIGGSTPPGDVQNFKLSVTNGLALFQWSPNEDVDISHYVIRYTGSTQNVSWENAQTAMDNIKGTNITNAIHKGTYLIKAVDYYGNESINATAIISDFSGSFENIVEEFIEDTSWAGQKTNVSVTGDIIELNAGETEGYYYFANQSFDLGDIYTCSLTSNVYSIVESRNRIRDISAIRNIDYGIRNLVPTSQGAPEWFVQLQMNLSDDNLIWSGWQPFEANQQTFRYIKFRLYFYCVDTTRFTPRVSICRVTIDMPDRYESGEDIEITNATSGATVTYSTPFRNNPSVNITVQNGAVDDKIEFISKTNQGFTIKIFNGTLNSYVTRSFDFIAAGYGKVKQ